jgi:hypothetical protein
MSVSMTEMVSLRFTIGEYFVPGRLNSRELELLQLQQLKVRRHAVKIWLASSEAQLVYVLRDLPVVAAFLQPCCPQLGRMKY